MLRSVTELILRWFEAVPAAQRKTRMKEKRPKKTFGEEGKKRRNQLE